MLEEIKNNNYSSSLLCPIRTPPLNPLPACGATVYTQVKIFHVETVFRLELKFQAHSESPLKWTGTNFF
jgi:hypothetical protein